MRNVIGTHAGAYALYRALAIAAGKLAPDHRPDLTDTTPAGAIGPYPQWGEPERIVSLDPWGHMTSEVFADRIAAGWDIRPTIAVTRARINMPEIAAAVRAGRLEPDGAVLTTPAECRVTKIAIEPVWHLPGVAAPLRHRHDGSATRPVRADRRDVPRTGDAAGSGGVPAADRWQHRSTSWATRALLGRPETRIACRVHDECNGSDVFGSDICTCRPYLAHGVEVCVRDRAARRRGVVVYNRKEGRALGEVTKFWSIMHASARPAAIVPRHISSAPNASRGWPTCAFRNSCRTCCTGWASRGSIS